MTEAQRAAGGYVDVGPVASLPAGAKASVDIDGEPVGLYNVDGQIFAMDDFCTHDEAYLSEGDFNPSAGTIRCHATALTSTCAAVGRAHFRPSCRCRSTRQKSSRAESWCCSILRA
jgi:naphthalene 1,2-dioxygenase system ferredoxin subunit